MRILVELPPPLPPPPSLAERALPLLRRWWRPVLLLVLLLVGLSWAGYTLWRFWPVPQLRVTVVGPTDTPAGQDVLLSVINACRQLDHVEVVEAPEGVSDVAAATGAEAITVAVTTADESWQIELRRGKRRVQYSVPLRTVGALGPRGLLASVTASKTRLLFERRRGHRRGLLDVPPGEWAEYLAFIQDEAAPPGDMDWEGFLDRLERHVADHPNNTDARAKAARIAVYLAQTRGDDSFYGRAEAVLTGADQADPQTIWAQARLAIARRQLDEVETLAARLHPGLHQLWLQAQVLLSSQDYAQARDLLLSADSSCWFIELQLVEAEINLGLVKRARRRIERLRAIAPGNTRILYQQAWFEVITGEPDHAVELATKLVHASPQPDHLVLRATAWMINGEYREAIADLRLAQRFGYRHGMAWLYMADCYQLLGDEEKAAELYRRTVQTCTGPEFDSAVYRAQALAALSDPTATQLAATLTPGTQLQYYTLADVYARAGDPTTAARYVKVALQAGLSTSWLQFPWFKATLVAVADLGLGQQ